MTKQLRREGTALLLALLIQLAAVGASAGTGSAATPAGEWELDGKVFGMPEAEVLEDDTSGPPVTGEFLTLAPELAPLPPGNRTHEVRMDVVVREIEIAPGVRYQAWTFGGSVPGPILHVREGDRVIFTMKNRSAEKVDVAQPSQEAGTAASPYLAALAALDPQKGVPAAFPMPHAIDMHAGTVAMSDKWRTIHPGETVRMEWVANYPGVFLYHCGTPPVFQHMSMGQYGVVVVSPRDGFPTDELIDREYVIIQSEFYLKPGPDGPDGLFVLDYEAALAKQPMVVAFNGHKTGLVDRPLVAQPGERVRLYVHDVGPTDTASFHVIGTIFDRVFYEGNPRNDWAGMQTVFLGASNGAVVEFIVPEPGGYAFVDHEFADAARGAVGLLVTDTAAGGAEGAFHGH